MPRVTDAHRESRRRQILDASIECFAREGFHRTSMTQIIAEAGVSAGTIYLYFTSKEKIVEAIAEERHALESALASTALANPNTRQALHDLAAGYLDWLSDPLEQKRRRVTVQVWAEALRNERVASIVRDGVGQRHQIADFVRDRQDGGDLIADVDADALSRAMLSLILGSVLQQAWDPTLDVDGYRTVLDAMIDRFLLVGRSTQLHRTGAVSRVSRLRGGNKPSEDRDQRPIGSPDRAGSRRVAAAKQAKKAVKGSDQAARSQTARKAAKVAAPKPRSTARVGV